MKSLILIAVFLISTQICYAQENALEGKITDVEYSVYSSLFDKLPTITKQTPHLVYFKNIVLMNKTSLGGSGIGKPSPEEITDALKQKFPGDIDLELVNRFIILNRKPLKIDKKIHLSAAQVYLYSGKELNKILNNDSDDFKVYWRNFHNHFPDASIVDLSRVALSKDGKGALVYFSYERDNLWGAGYYVLLAEGKDGWEIIAIGCGWVS